MSTTQCERILKHLEENGRISSAEAINQYGILRLASRVNDLKRRGYPISSQMVEGKNRYGETTRYAVYRLEDR